MILGDRKAVQRILDSRDLKVLNCIATAVAAPVAAEREGAFCELVCVKRLRAHGV
jgi:hypothetical protein